MSDLLSKVTASGLSAGVFLLWWPAHVTSQGGDALLVRGVLWALAFEILLLAFRPLERAVGAAVRSREAGAIAPRRIGPLVALAAVAAIVPAAMLCGSRAPIAARAKAAAPKVIVKREIVRRTVVVRRVNRVVRVAAPATTTAAPAAAPQAAPVVRATSATQTSTPAKSTPTRKTATTTAATTGTSTSTTTTPKPTATATATATQPTTTAPAAPAATASATQAASAAKTAGG